MLEKKGVKTGTNTTDTDLTGSYLTNGQEQQEEAGSTKDINKCYMFMHVLTVALGFMQFGIGMSSWSPTQPAFQVFFEWTDDETTLYGDGLQSVCILGAAVGALSCSKLLPLGKLKLIYYLNIVLVIGVAISLIGKFYWLMCIGRFIWGFSFGAFSVVSAKMVNEIVPVELGGSFGAVNQMALCFGSALPGTIGLAYPINFDGYPKDDFYVQQYFRIIWSAPLVVALIQVLLVMFVFSFDTPVFLKEKGREEELLIVMKKYYRGMEVRKRLDALNSVSAEGQGEEISIKETFFNPEIRKAAWVGFMLVTLQQLSGVNAILFYAGQLFGHTDGNGLSPSQAAALINWANFIAAGLGAYLLGFFGRRTLMIASYIVCIIGMFGMFVFQQLAYNETMLTVLCIVFIFGFEAGLGPIVWLYLSEICNNQATSVNTVVNWIWTLVISISTPPMSSNLEGWTWLPFSCFLILGFVYVLFTMKETRGVPKDQVKLLYNKNQRGLYDPIH